MGYVCINYKLSSVVGVEDICIVKVNELSLNRTTFNCVEKFDSKVLLMIFVLLVSQPFVNTTSSKHKIKLI